MKCEASLPSVHPYMELRMNKSTTAPSSRILYDIPCRVCQDHSSGKHYGIFACDGCAGFFKRSIRRNRQYVCKAKNEHGCVVDKTHRNQCRACRLRKCVEAGMNKDAVQHERGPRNSTLRRQMSLFYHKDASDSSTPSPTAGTAPSLTPPVFRQHPSVPKFSPVVTSSGPGSNARSPATVPPTAVGDLHPHMSVNERLNLLAAVRPSLLCVPQPQYPREMFNPFPVAAWTMAPETICESAARLLFMNVRWAKSVPAFTALPHRDQVALLEESWRELFVLGAAQFMLPIDPTVLMGALGLGGANSPFGGLAGSLSSAAGLSAVSSERHLGLLSEIKTFQETVSKFKQLNVDPTEYACLRAVILFKTTAGLRELPSCHTLQDQAQLALNRYVATAYPTQPLRFGRLLLLLPALRTVAASTIEELFFRKTIGNIPIERIISDMYKSGDL